MRFILGLRLTIAAVAMAVFAIGASDSRATTTRDPNYTGPRAEGFLIVVHESNAISTVSRSGVSRYFLKKASKWDSGVGVMPVDLPPDSPVRDAFSRRVLSRSVSSVRAYWQQQIFSGRDVPPPEKANDAAVLEFVQTNPTAIAYVSPLATLPRGVRALTITE